MKEEFTVIEGKRPLLISAPHNSLHKRPNLSGRYRQAEEFTGEIVKEVCALTGAWGIYLSKNTDYDPSYFPLVRNPYKKEVKRICKENDIKYFIDIHGMALDSHLDFAFYYPLGFRNSKKLTSLLEENLPKGKLEGCSVVVYNFPESPRKSLSEFTASKLRIPSSQIETARYIREEKELREVFINNLADVITKHFV